MTEKPFSIQDKNVPLSLHRNVPSDLLVTKQLPRHYIKSTRVNELAVEKGFQGITYSDIMKTFHESKKKSQRTLKHFHSRKIIFTAQDLISKGIELPINFRNTKPQRYYASSIKANILEKIKNGPVRPTGINDSSMIILPHGPSHNSISNVLHYQRAQSFLEALVLLPFTPLFIHRIHLLLYVNRQYFNDIAKNERSGNRAKTDEEIIGRRLVRYTLSPNGTIEITVRSSDDPFRIQSNDDESNLFAFLGQVRDRLLYLLQDLKERAVPSIMKWRLIACDLNKDIKINEKAQMFLPDIQLKHADRVFRLYIKTLHDKSILRVEESLKLDLVLTEGLDNIRHPFKSFEDKMDLIIKLIQREVPQHARPDGEVNSTDNGLQ